MSSENLDFALDMQKKGLACKEAILADGKIYRFHVEGDRKGTKNGWYIFFGAAGSFGYWKTGEKHIWSSKGTRLPDVIYRKIQAQIAQNYIDQKIEKYNNNLNAASLAQKEWALAMPANEQHPYLITKCVKPHGLRQNKHKLLVPIIDFHGTIWNLQTIFANGEKRFAQGGRINALFSPIGINNIGRLSQFMICEGWATGASLHEVTGVQVLCAMNAGNLYKVAKEARNFFPDAGIIIAADNDRHTDGNPGLTYAMKAAMEINALIMCPQFPDGVDGSDYNDAVRMGWRG